MSPLLLLQPEAATRAELRAAACDDIGATQASAASGAVTATVVTSRQRAALDPWSLDRHGDEAVDASLELMFGPDAGTPSVCGERWGAGD